MTNVSASSIKGLISVPLEGSIGKISISATNSAYLSKESRLLTKVSQRDLKKIFPRNSQITCSTVNGSAINGTKNGAVSELMASKRGQKDEIYPNNQHSGPTVIEEAYIRSTVKALTSQQDAVSNAVRASPVTLSISKGTSEGFSTVEEAVASMKEGKIVLIVNPEKPDDIVNFVCSGNLASKENMTFMVNYGSGLVFCPTAPDILERLELPLMVGEDHVSGVTPLPFAVTIDLLEGTSTGISAADRAMTIRHVASSDPKSEDFRKPGHVIPLKTNAGGVLLLAGHPEAAVDLARLADQPPVAAMCALTNPDGSMGQLADAHLLARRHNLCLVSIPDIVRHRRASQKLVERTAIARLPTKWGEFQVVSYTSLVDGIEHVAMVKGDLTDGQDVLCRVHSECLTGDIFGSQRCDCGPQLEQAMMRIERAGRGVLVYMRGQEGRGIGLGKKLLAYNLQDLGRDTVEANEDLGLPVDSREYGASAQILRDLGVKSLRLMTNNPAKFEALQGYGIEVKSRVPVLCPITLENKRYLDTKREKMGHLYANDITGIFGRLPTEIEDQ